MQGVNQWVRYAPNVRLKSPLKGFLGINPEKMDCTIGVRIVSKHIMQNITFKIRL
jgi:hypothetical protein